MAQYMAVSELPPVPDDNTGLPLPPPSRLVRGQRIIGTAPPDSATPPPKHGPAFAWHAKTKRYAIQVGAILAVVVLLAVLLLQGFAAIEYWWIPVPVAVVGGVFATWIVARTPPIAAGARWFRKGKRWLRLYDITKVTMMRQPFGMDSWITFKDKWDHSITISQSLLKENPLIFDLVRCGVLHSAIRNHAVLNKPARTALDIPYPDDARRR